MDIAVLGAAGEVGRALAIHLLKGGILGAGDSLTLVGHGADAAEHRLLPEQTDLRDAFDDRVNIRVAATLDAMHANIVVVACGATISASCPTRAGLAQANTPLFRDIVQVAGRCAADALVIVVSNPIELAVYLLSQVLPRHRVIGMGAQQDSLRFARALADDLGISRHDLRATVVGEHGVGMVPLWSSVDLLLDDPELRARLAALRSRAAHSPLIERARALRTEVEGLMAADRVADAYAATRAAMPDARIFVEPFITQRCLHSTPHATANATACLIEAILADDSRQVHGQVRLEGEALGIHGVFGTSLSLCGEGWRLGCPIEPDTSEAAMIVASAATIRDATASATEAFA